MGKVNFLSSLFSISDEQAMWRVQTQDDLRAFAHLVERWEEPIRRLCVRMTGDSHRGEDLKQETFARVFEKRERFQPNARFSTWLWRIALNLCYDELRRTQRRGESPLETDESSSLGLFREFVAEGPTPDAQLAKQEEGELVRRALLRLPEIYRTALVLRHYENLKLREIAEILGIPVGTVNSRLAEGLAQLTRILEPQFDEQHGRPVQSGAAGGTVLNSCNVEPGGSTESARSADSTSESGHGAAGAVKPRSGSSPGSHEKSSFTLTTL